MTSAQSSRVRLLIGTGIALAFAGQAARAADLVSTAVTTTSRTVSGVTSLVSGTTASLATGTGPVRPLAGNVQPNWGNIRTFWGEASPFWGNIRTFWGDTSSPYDGNLTAFWGNIRTFNDGSDPASLTPLWGNIRTFMGDVGASWGNIRTFWGNIRTFEEAPGDYDALAGQLRAMADLSAATWGAAVQAKTGQGFAAGFADPLFARYGIDLADPSTLARLDAGQREHFFIDWYDGLMAFSGADRVDHWMKTIGWTPAITQTLGAGRRTTIGVLDFSLTGDVSRNVVSYDGISTFTNGHGSAVASLIVSAHDGQGVMGIAPKASVVAYNPFDATGTAGWADIRTGVLTLVQSNATVINASLGVPGWTLHGGWNDVFKDGQVANASKGKIFVLAAGNDGVSQSQNIVWAATNPATIVVGSVDPTETISAFSNRPGTACLGDGVTCKPGSELRNRFIVAPGEFILVSDGAGGVVRRSGTSFAAPLVAGTVALIHDRWPWLANNPNETAQIILKSAKDLGAPGVDPVYGVGLLDVPAALSPLSFDALKWYSLKSGKLVEQKVSRLQSGTDIAKWEADGVFFYAYEPLGATYRDFAIPMSSKLVGQTVMSAGGTMEQLQSYIYSRYTGWITPPKANKKGFALANAAVSAVPNGFGASLTMSIAPRTPLVGYRQANVPFQSAVSLAAPDGRVSLTVGEGDGAAMLGGVAGLATASDYDPFVGGANPLLGFASGGGYMQAGVALGDRLSLSAGVTRRELRRDFSRAGLLEQAGFLGLSPYRAQAQHVTARYRAGAATTLTATYTRLREPSALLGTQSVDRTDLAGGSTTTGMTLAADVALGRTLSLTATGTVSRTRSPGAQAQNLAVSSGGLVGSAFQLALGKERVLDKADRLRLTLSQPLHLERGGLDVTTVQVIDRDTGELGAVTNRIDLASPRRQLFGEMLYARGVLEGAAELRLFGRANLNGTGTDRLPSLMAGTGLSVAF